MMVVLTRRIVRGGKKMNREGLGRATALGLDERGPRDSRESDVVSILLTWTTGCDCGEHLVRPDVISLHAVNPSEDSKVFVWL